MNNRKNLNLRKVFDKAGQFFAWLASSITIAACLGIVVYLFVNGFKQISPEFLFTEPNPTINEEFSGGISSPLLGTILLTVIGIAFAFPWALATAIYLAEYAKKNIVTSYFRLAIDVLAGIPTIVIAIFGLAVFSLPQLGFLSSMVEGVEGVNRAYGRSFIVAGLTMAVMILPFITKTCEEAIKQVPETFKEGSLAMGASKWHTIMKIVLPSSRNGILTGVIIGMGRIIGDTAIVWLTLGGSIRMNVPEVWWSPDNWFDTVRSTGSTLTTYIFYTSAGEGNAPSKAFGASFVLIVVIILLNFIADILSRNRKFSNGE